MNRYGAIAERWWRLLLPSRVAEMEDPDAFFSALGEEVEQRILDTADDLARHDCCEQGYLANVYRLHAARVRAEAVVLEEMVLLPPEPGISNQELVERVAQANPDLRPFFPDCLVR